MAQIERVLRVIGARQDLVIVVALFFIIGLMIVPLPTWLMDVMIALNITLGLLFILLAIYIRTPLDFSTLPSAILISTLLRMSITIATSRLILIQADAGEIITAFGQFVVSGNLIVGLVVYAIIAIAQFVVVTRGSERVAEVAARFTLDALPGKQMSIDSDLRAGDIDRHEARRRRHALERESQYFGAMDGAMKFVKGDAIVSMIIIFVNLVGGLVVGTAMHNLSVSEAFSTYAILTVGDGLVSQIPALLVSISGGLVVTRVQSEESKNIGADLARELISSPKSLGVVSAALLGLGFVPGFPTLTFLVLSALAAGGAYAMQKRQQKKAIAEHAAAAAQADGEVGAGDAPKDIDLALKPAQPGDVYTLRLSPSIAATFDQMIGFLSMSHALTEYGNDLGVALPAPGLRQDPSLGEGVWALDVEGAESWRATAWPDRLFVPAVSRAAIPADVEQRQGELPYYGPGAWIGQQDAERLGEDQSQAIAGSIALARAAAAVCAHWSSKAMGVQEADTWLNALGTIGYTSLVQQVRQQMTLVRLADTLRHLLSEGIPLTQPRILLEALLEYAPKVDDNAALADHVRLNLSRPLSARFAGEGRAIHACIIEPDLEEQIRQSLKESPTGIKVNLENDRATRLAQAIHDWQNKTVQNGSRMVVFTSFDIRRPIHDLLAARGLNLPILAFDEVAPDYRVVPVGMLGAGIFAPPPRTA
jgi:type III secretion protein V